MPIGPRPNAPPRYTLTEACATTAALLPTENMCLNQMVRVCFAFVALLLLFRRVCGFLVPRACTRCLSCLVVATTLPVACQLAVSPLNS
jgi:hypothetical protein